MRIAWLILLMLLIDWLLWQAIVPLGKMTYQIDFKQQSYAIGRLLPADRVVKDNGYQKLIAEPVYFSLYTPRAFNKAVVTVEFSNPPELVKFGVAHNKDLWNYDLKTAYAKSSEKINLAENQTVSSILEFDLTRAERLDNKYTFIISAPGLNGQKNNFIIKNIKLEFFGLNLKQLVSSHLK